MEAKEATHVQPHEEAFQPALPAALARPMTPSSSLSVFGDVQSFETAQRMAKALSTSTLVPETYRNSTGNCLIAMEVASRVGASILAVTQNLHIIEGRPSWGAPFIIAAINGCGRFTPLRFRVTEIGRKEVPYEYWEGPKGQRQKKTGKMTVVDKSCVAWATDKATGDKLESPAVSFEMAIREGWYSRPGSKWQTMPDVMLMYRSAAFFGRLYAGDILMGMHTSDEAEDIGPTERDVTPPRAPPPVVAPPAARASGASPAAPKRGRKAAVIDVLPNESDDEAMDRVAEEERARPPVAEAAPQVQPPAQAATPAKASPTVTPGAAQEGDIF